MIYMIQDAHRFHASRGDTVTFTGRKEVNEHNLAAFRGRAFPGVVVWRTVTEARAYIDTIRSMRRDAMPAWLDGASPFAAFSVFAIDADWDEDTYRPGYDSWQCLLRDSEMVRTVTVDHPRCGPYGIGGVA